MIKNYVNKAILGSAPVTKKPKDAKKTTKTIVKLLIMTILVSLTSIVWAQKDSLGTGEQLNAVAIRQGNTGAAGPPIAVKTEPTTPLVGTSMSPTKLSVSIKAAYGFLVGWGRGGSTNPSPSAYNPQTPITINTQAAGVVGDYALILPASGFQFTNDRVRITNFLIRDKTGKNITGPASLMTDPSGKITQVVVPTP